MRDLGPVSFTLFNRNQQVMVDLYGDIITLFQIFFEDGPTWFRMFDQSAQAVSENWNILGKNNTIRVMTSWRGFNQCGIRELPAHS